MLHGMGLRATDTVKILIVLQVSPFVEEYLAAPYASPQSVDAFHSVSSQGLSAIGETGERSENLSSHIVTLILSEVDVGRGSTLIKKLSLDANW